MRPLRIKDYIGESFLEDTSVCDKFIDFYEEIGGKRVTGNRESIEAHVGEGVKDREKIKHINPQPGRKCVDISVTLEEIEHNPRYNFMTNTLVDIHQKRSRYEKRIGGTLYNSMMLEGFNIQKYTPPHDVYAASHFEHSGRVEFEARRLYVFMVYLNDVKSGGHTVFPSYNRRFKPRKGKFLIWPPYYTHPHYGEPSEEAKYIMPGWFTQRYNGETEEELFLASRQYGLLSRAKSYFEQPLLPRGIV